MSYFFNEVFFLQVLALVLICLLYINITPYAMLFLSMLLLGVLCLLVMYCGITLFAMYLVLIEMHVSYMILCLTFSWVRYDTVHITNLLSSNMLLGGRIFLVGSVLVCFGVFVDHSINVFWFNIDNYLYNILFSRVMNLTLLCTGVNLTILTSLTQAFLLINSFEFCLVNVLMLLATFLYFFIVAICRANSRLQETYQQFVISRFFRIKYHTVKRTKQVVQITRCASSFKKASRPLFVPRTNKKLS